MHSKTNATSALLGDCHFILSLHLSVVLYSDSLEPTAARLLDVTISVKLVTMFGFRAPFLLFLEDILLNESIRSYAEGL